MQICTRTNIDMYTHAHSHTYPHPLIWFGLIHSKDNPRTFAEIFLTKRESSREKKGCMLPRRTHEDLASFALWVYSEIG